MRFQEYDPVVLDITARPWLAAKPCHCPGCGITGKLRAGGWTCEAHAALPYVQSREVREALEAGIALMNEGIYARRLP